jgi:HAD superfamily hydrolase (TIGR01509 family)
VSTRSPTNAIGPIAAVEHGGVMDGPAAVIFDLDGVLIDSERTWNRAREQLVKECGGVWRADAQRAMMGMSSLEWSRYMREQLGVPMSDQAISATVVERLEQIYRQRLPLIAGAREAVTALSRRWPLAIASSANRALIALVLELACLGDCFGAIVSSEEVPRGKPAPDVYLEAARRIGYQPASCAAVEDSANGIRSAAAAAMHVVAIPNHAFAPSAEVLAHADVVLASIDLLIPSVIEDLTTARSS